MNAVFLFCNFCGISHLATLLVVHPPPHPPTFFQGHCCLVYSGGSRFPGRPICELHKVVVEVGGGHFRTPSAFVNSDPSPPPLLPRQSCHCVAVRTFLRVWVCVPRKVLHTHKKTPQNCRATSRVRLTVSALPFSPGNPAPSSSSSSTTHRRVTRTHTHTQGGQGRRRERQIGFLHVLQDVP